MYRITSPKKEKRVATTLESAFVVTPLQAATSLQQSEHELHHHYQYHQRQHHQKQHQRTLVCTNNNNTPATAPSNTVQYVAHHLQVVVTHAPTQQPQPNHTKTKRAVKLQQWYTCSTYLELAGLLLEAPLLLLDLAHTDHAHPAPGFFGTRPACGL